jgi:hypothetical protein
VAPLGLKAGVGGFANAALKGPLFHDGNGVRRSKPEPRIYKRIRQNKIKIQSVEIRG